MEPKNNLEWFAIQTKNGLEDLAAQTIATLGLETFFPRIREAAAKRRNHARQSRPLFPCYCFARFQPCAHLHAVRYSRGVVRVVGTEETPWSVEESIIDAVRLRMNDAGFVELEEVRFHPGERVRICDGPLEGWAGIFDSELDDQQRVVILLESFTQVKVMVNRDCVELAVGI
jgi:transcriptional antiterminator RfaH